VTDLRDQIRRAIAEADGFDLDGLEPHDYQRHADAVLALFQTNHCEHAAEYHGPETGCVECRCASAVGHG
jgi:hypothetical protein